jgi:2-hydroxychromene-2-carboxylate isomerase
LVTSDVKAALLENTQRAFDAGAFGLPWFECVNTEGIQEGFWGIDHLGRLADFLQLDTSLDQSFRVLL